MSTSEEPVADLLYGLNVRSPLRETLLVALQHVFAVFVGMITPPLLIAGALKLGSADTRRRNAARRENPLAHRASYLWDRTLAAAIRRTGRA